MNRILSIGLAALILISTLASCAPMQDQLDTEITLASSDASANAQWLEDRLGTISDDVVIGVGSNASYGIDFSNFEDDGYVARSMGGTVLLFGKTEAGLDRAVREYAKAVEAGENDLLNTVYHENVRIENFTVAGTDISEFTVVYNHDSDYTVPSKSEATVGNATYAADEFIRLVEIATGVTLPKSTEDVDGPMVKIDYLEDESFKENGFTYKVENGNLYINGKSDANGCANGVYHFLEYQCGWDGLMFGDSVLADSQDVSVENGLNVSVNPMFEYTYYWGINHLEFHGFGFDNLRSDYANGYLASYYGIVSHAGHGMATHDWAGSYEKGLQICYTSGSNYLNTFDKVYTRVREGIEAGEKIYEIDISQQDCFNYCMCKDCSKVYKEEGGAHSGAVVRFANRLAEDMEAEGYGGIKYTIFAYHGSNIPCKTLLHNDVYITVCADGSCSIHRFDGSDCGSVSFDGEGELGSNVSLNNKDYCEWLRGWTELSDNVYFWFYAIDNNFGQYTCFDYLYDDFQIYRELDLKGLYWEGESGGLGLGRIRFQLVNALIYNPGLTEEEYNVLRDGIFKREYGDGYEYVLDYISVWRQAEVNVGCNNCWGYNDLLSLSNVEMSVYSGNFEVMIELLNSAMEQANCEQQELNVKRLIMEVMYRYCAYNYYTAVENEDTRLLAHLNTYYDTFVQYAHENGYDMAKFPQAGTSSRSFNLSDTIGGAAEKEWAKFRDELMAWHDETVYEHVVIVGVDGAGNFWDEAGAENVARIFENGASTEYCRAANPTISGQNWASLMTGVAPLYHNIDNSVMEVEPYKSSVYPTIFKLVRYSMPGADLASFCNWNPINIGLVEDGIGVVKGSGTDEQMAQEASEYFIAEEPALMYVHFDSIDAAGHDYGSSSAMFAEALRAADVLVGQIYDAVVESGELDDTLFIVTADHGHTTTGGHGGQSKEETDIFFGAAGRTMIKNNNLENMNIRDIAAIVCHALGARGNDANWDSYIPQNMFSDLPSPVQRETVSAKDHVTLPTPEEGSAGHISEFIDTSKLKTAIFFDGNLEADYGSGKGSTSTNAGYYDGYYGSALEISEGCSFSLDRVKFGKDSFTLSFWMQSSDGEAWDRVPLFANKVWTPFAESKPGFALIWSQIPQVDFCGAGNIMNSVSVGVPDDFEAEEWYHVILNVDRETNKISYYYNFDLVYTWALPDELKEVSFDTRSPLVFGSDASGISSGFYGLIDDLMIFNGALSEKEIASLCNYYFQK